MFEDIVDSICGSRKEFFKLIGILTEDDRREIIVMALKWAKLPNVSALVTEPSPSSMVH
jgi:hypothetical protein